MNHVCLFDQGSCEDNRIAKFISFSGCCLNALSNISGLTGNFNTHVFYNYIVVFQVGIDQLKCIWGVLGFPYFSEHNSRNKQHGLSGI